MLKLRKQKPRRKSLSACRYAVVMFMWSFVGCVNLHKLGMDKVTMHFGVPSPTHFGFPSPRHFGVPSPMQLGIVSPMHLGVPSPMQPRGPQPHDRIEWGGGSSLSMWFCL